MKSYHKSSPNFVAPAQTQRAEIVEVVRDLPSPPQNVLLPTANYTDRARGFTLSTGPLAAATGFTVAWLIAYLAHAVVSPMVGVSGEGYGRATQEIHPSPGTRQALQSW